MSHARAMKEIDKDILKLWYMKVYLKHRSSKDKKIKAIKRKKEMVEMEYQVDDGNAQNKQRNFKGVTLIDTGHKIYTDI